MGAYQYYEFLALDRELDDRQQAELRAMSTRAEITATKFVNEYHWGDFGGNPSAMMERYFDAHLYNASWGSHQLMLRLPETLLKLDLVEQYCVGDVAGVWRHGDHVILNIHSEDEDGEWEETDETRLGELIAIRSDLAAGDHRALYLAWLLAAERELELEEHEPPVPPGLAQLTGPLRALADFLRVDEDLLAVAAQASDQVRRDPTEEDAAAFVTNLPPADKDALLVRLLAGDSRVILELRRRFRSQFADAPTAGTRTVGQLLDEASERRDGRAQQALHQAAEERAQREREEAESRERRIDSLASNLEKAWTKVEALIETKRPSDYDSAVALLVDLRSLSTRNGEESAFAERLDRLRTEHRRKPSLMERFERAGL